jgi:hypothetical protein
MRGRFARHQAAGLSVGGFTGGLIDHLHPWRCTSRPVGGRGRDPGRRSLRTRTVPEPMPSRPGPNCRSSPSGPVTMSAVAGSQSCRTGVADHRAGRRALDRAPDSESGGPSDVGSSKLPALLDHPVDHPDDLTGFFWIRLDRRGVQREQARSVWSRPERRRAPGYGSGGWGFESLAARTIAPGQRPGATCFACLVGSPMAVFRFQKDCHQGARVIRPLLCAERIVTPETTGSSPALVSCYGWSPPRPEG